MTPTRIIRVDADSAPRLAALHAASFDKPWSSDAMASLVSGPGGFPMIAAGEEGDRGFILFHCVPPEAELLSVGVAPHWRRHGLGAQLIRTAAAHLYGLQVEAMLLEVATDNVAAFALYRRLGFSEVTRRRGYYGGAIDAIVMRATLADIVG